MRLALLVAMLALPLWPARAEALTVRDIVELTHAGLGEDVLLALIEVDPSVFPIDAATIKRLKAEGVSERIIVAMVRSARTVPTPPPDVPMDSPAVAPTPEPQVVVIDHHDSPEIRQVPVAVPVYVPYVVRSRHDSRATQDTRVTHDDVAGSVMSVPPHTPSAEHPRVQQPEPVYWGFGGKLRPDAWQPTPDTKKKQNER